jgi:hypothetical protein
MFITSICNSCFISDKKTPDIEMASVVKTAFIHHKSFLKNFETRKIKSTEIRLKIKFIVRNLNERTSNALAPPKK